MSDRFSHYVQDFDNFFVIFIEKMKKFPATLFGVWQNLKKKWQTKYLNIPNLIWKTLNYYSETCLNIGSLDHQDPSTYH